MTVFCPYGSASFRATRVLNSLSSAAVNFLNFCFADLLDDDVTDDIHCVKEIYDEHKRLSGNGFNAWSVLPGVNL